MSTSQKQTHCPKCGFPNDGSNACGGCSPPYDAESKTTRAAVLHDYEYNALIDWHLDEQFKAAEKQEYMTAEDHKKRIKELKDILNAK